jgi:hypothetical protein
MSKNIGIFIHPESGNVGIGTSQPRAQLEVFGSVVPSSNLGYDLGSPTLRWRELYLSGNSINLDGTLISRDATSGGIKFQTPSGAPVDSFARTLTASNTGTGPALKVTQTGANSIAEFYDDGNALAVKIADGGNVGIGASIMIDKLCIASSGTTDYHGIRFYEHITSTYGGFLKYHNGEDRLTLGTTNNSIDINALNIDRNTGSVGIGTTQPQANLHINGDINFTGVLKQNLINSSSIRNVYLETDTTSRSFTTSYVVGMTWANRTYNAYSRIILDIYVPIRNNSASWGGVYTYVEYNVNSSGWTFLGHSGYTGVMSSGGGDIGFYTNTFFFPFNIASNFTCQFRFQHKSYDDTGYVNQSTDAGTGSTNSYGISTTQFFSKIIIIELSP